MARRRNPDHPTRSRLIETVVNLSRAQTLESITSDQVLATSGISKGSLYHHFEDFEDLIGAAAIELYIHGVEEDISQLETLLAGCNSKEGFHRTIDALTEISQSPERRPVRLERIHLLAFADRNERLRKLLATAQQQKTDSLADIVRASQAKGWVAADLDPVAVAVFVQSYTLGRAVDDVAEKPVDSQSWIALIKRITREVLGATSNTN